MIIKNQQPLSLAQAQGYTKNLEEKKELKDYFKKYTKISKDKAEALIKEIRDLNNPKINEANTVKVADFLPTDSTDLNKIFTEVALTEEEANSIIGIVKTHGK